MPAVEALDRPTEPRHGERANAYHFVTRWRVPGRREEVAEIINDVAALPRWWPSVYLDVRVLEAGDDDGVGRVADLWTKGWLPYTLRWRFTTAARQGAEGVSLHAEGDFRGIGTWTFTQDGDRVDVEYDWRISAEKPLLRRLTRLLRPVFEANHLWAMRRGEQSLLLELQRRRAPDAAARRRVPAPPPATFARLTRTAGRRRSPVARGRPPHRSNVICPVSNARATACARVCAPSLLIALATWDLTVAGDTNSDSAMSGPWPPSAISVMTSRSRLVSCSASPSVTASCGVQTGPNAELPCDDSAGLSSHATRIAMCRAGRTLAVALNSTGTGRRPATDSS